ncbi:hypothetical protein Tco_1212858 [Tanacetum coccineum]
MGGDLQGEDFAQRMVELINQRKKKFAEERARAKRNKLMTQLKLIKEVKEEKTPKKTGKRIKQIARRGVHFKEDSSQKDDEEMKSWLSLVLDKDKEVEFEILYILSKINKEDLNAIHKLVMDKYRDDEPEGFDRILWGDLMMLDLKLQTKQESETALELIRFIKKQVKEIDLKRIEGDEKDS